MKVGTWTRGSHETVIQLNAKLTQNNTVTMVIKKRWEWHLIGPYLTSAGGWSSLSTVMLMTLRLHPLLHQHMRLPVGDPPPPSSPLLRHQTPTVLGVCEDVTICLHFAFLSAINHQDHCLKCSNVLNSLKFSSQTRLVFVRAYSPLSLSRTKTFWEAFCRANASEYITVH